MLETNNYLGLQQTSFRPHLSAHDNFAFLHHDVTRSRTRKTPMLLDAVDIKKAFDPAPRDSILRAAEGRGFGGRTIGFVRKFLQDREFEIAVGDLASPCYPSKIDMLQGSVQPPTLFETVMTETIAFRRSPICIAPCTLTM